MADMRWGDSSSYDLEVGGFHADRLLHIFALCRVFIFKPYPHLSPLSPVAVKDPLKQPGFEKGNNNKKTKQYSPVKTHGLQKVGNNPDNPCQASK